MTIPGMVTIVIPCFNAQAYLDDALCSVRNQTYGILDIIAVNDGSTDETLRLLERHAESDPRVRIVTQPNRGLAAARNAGLKQARGEFVSFLDADDTILPDKIDKQLRYLRSHPDIDLVYSDYFIGDSRLDLIGLVVVRIPSGDRLDSYSRQNWFGVMSPLVRRSMIETVGDFDETLRASEDWDYWIRCVLAGAFGHLPGPVAVYRTHSSQMHNDSGRMLGAQKRVVNKHFRSDRRRYRLAMAALYEASAKYAWGAQRRVKAGIYAALSTYHSKIASVSRPARGVSRLVEG